MHKENLTKLADFLETVPCEKFNMNNWSRGWPEDGIQEAFPVLGTRCGFAGCAMGWAVTGRLFENLRWSGEVPVVTDESGYYRGFDAAMQLFEIDGDAAEKLFGPYNNVTPKQEAKRIRAYVCGGSAAVTACDAKRRNMAFMRRKGKQ